MDKKIKAAVLAVLVLGGAYGGYSYYAGHKADTAKVAVQKIDVKRMDLKSTVAATGTIGPVHSVEVSSKITARIKTVLVKENEHVKQGQTVATLDGKDYEAKREQAQFKVKNAQSKYERAAYLYGIGAVTQEEYEDAVYNYETAMSNLTVTESDLAETVITAPMDGVVVGEPQTPGTMAVQGVSNPTIIMRIADLSSKEIKAKIDETDIGSVKVGQQATFTVDAYNNRKFTARVSRISQTDVTSSWDKSSSSGSGSSSSSVSVVYYYVTLEVDDPEGLLLPGMTARVDVSTSERNNALALPISALKTNAKGAYVMLVNPDGTTKEQPVKTGIYSDEYVEIVEGLQDGDVVSNSYKAPAKQTTGNKPSGGGRPGGPIPRF